MIEICCEITKFSLLGLIFFTKIDSPRRKEIRICSILELFKRDLRNHVAAKAQREADYGKFQAPYDNICQKAFFIFPYCHQGSVTLQMFEKGLEFWRNVEEGDLELFKQVIF